MADKVYKVLIEILGKDNASSDVKNVDASLASLGKGALAVSAVLVTAMVAAKKAFEFGEEGANILRLEEAGDNLAASLGGNMDDIVSALQQASQGTVANADIILAANRAMMLGLGADADKLANLMEVAALRGRAMGLSTTQAFSDIVTGIGRMSPMILDNLGIVIDAEKRFGDYAKAMGITTEQIDSAAKKQILLDGVLEDGNKALALTGGLVEDTATSYEQFGVATDNLTASGKKLLAEALLPTVKGLAEWLGQLDKNVAGQRLAVQAVKDGTMSQATYNKMVWDNARGLEVWSQYLDQINFQLGFHQMNVERLNAEYGQGTDASSKWGDALEQMYYHQAVVNEATRQSADEYDAAAAAADELNGEIFDLNRENRSLIASLDTLTPKLDDFFSGIDRDLGSPISNFIDDLKFMQAGGGAFQGALEGIQRALVDGKITPAQAEAFASELQVAFEQTMVDAGLQTKQEAAQAISDALGVPLAEAYTQLGEFTSGVDALTAVKHDLDIEVLTTDRMNTLAIIEEMMQGGTYTLDVVVNFSSSGGGGGGGSGGQWGKGASSSYEASGYGTEGGAQAAGGSWLVDEPTHFMAGEAGPEYAFFVPKSKMGAGQGGGGGGGDMTIINNYRDAAAAALGMALVERERRERLGW